MNQHEQNQLVAALDELESQATKTAKAVEKLVEQRNELLEALEALFDDYKQLADSGDAGNWYLEDQAVGKQALAAIAKAKGL